MCASIRLYYVLPKQFCSLNVTYVNDNNKKYLDIKYVCGFYRSYCFCLIVKCPQCIYTICATEKSIFLVCFGVVRYELLKRFLKNILFSAKWVMFLILSYQSAKGKAPTLSILVTDFCFFSFRHNSVMYWVLIWDLKMGKSHHSVINPSLSGINQ